MARIDGHMETPLRLAYIVGTYPSVSTTFIHQEVRTLWNWGVDLRMVSIRPPGAVPAEQHELQHGTLYLLPVDWRRFIRGHLYFGLRCPAIYFKTLFYLLSRHHPSPIDWLKTALHFAEGVYAAELLRDQPLGGLHAHFVDRAATVALVAARLLGLRYSVTAHAGDIYTKKVLLREKMREAAFVVTVSEFNKAHLIETYPGLNADQIYVLHPWVDMSRFQPPPARAGRKTLRILSTGRLVEKKGHRHLIEACHLLHEKGVDFECRIIGDGPLRSELRADIERYSLAGRVHLLGARPQSDVLNHLSWCDVFALACVIAKNGDRDGMPVALAEAMAMAVPVVSCDILGIRELVRPNVGFLVPPHNAQALSDALQTVDSLDDSQRAEMGCRGRAVVDADFSLLAGTRNLEALFRAAYAHNGDRAGLAGVD
jgi:glycosyltransferase involved in cell wall biosynthesis